MDSRKDEQERGITMKSSAVALHHSVARDGKGNVRTSFFFRKILVLNSKKKDNRHRRNVGDFGWLLLWTMDMEMKRISGKVRGYLRANG